MGNLDHFVDVRESILQREVHEMITTSIEIAFCFPVQAEVVSHSSILASCMERLDNLTTTVEANSPIHLPYVSGTNALNDATPLPPTLDVSGIDARGDTTPPSHRIRVLHKHSLI
uniref:Uncharacterized protein n=1 Tax=Solanum tuberosum TaxID=4113 RepID=M1DVW6_SOLTU